MSQPTQRIRDLLALGRHDAALQMVGALLAENPDDAELHRLQSWAHLLLRNGAEAARSAERSVRHDPEHPEGHRLRALGLHEVGFDQFATGPARQAIRLAPNDPDNHAVLARVLSALGQHHEAWRSAERAIELDPTNPDVHALMGDVAAAYPAPDVAATAYQRALSLDPSHAVARHNLATVETAEGAAKGLRGFAAALRLDPQLPEGRMNLDRLSLAMLIWARVTSQVILIAAVLGHAFGVSWLGVALVGLALLVAALLWSRLPGNYRRSWPSRAASGFGIPDVAAVNATATALFALIACALVLVPSDLTAAPAGFGLIAALVFYGLNSWTVGRLQNWVQR